MRPLPGGVHVPGGVRPAQAAEGLPESPRARRAAAPPAGGTEGDGGRKNGLRGWGGGRTQCYGFKSNETNETFLRQCVLSRQVVPSVEESITVAHIVVEASSIADEIGNASAIVGELQIGGELRSALAFTSLLSGTCSLVLHPLLSDLRCGWVNDVSVLHAWD